MGDVTLHARSRAIRTAVLWIFLLATSYARAAVTVVPFGSTAFKANPTWQPVDFHFFTAPIGDAGNGFAGFSQVQQTLFPGPGYGFDLNHNGVIPGSQPVPGPYGNVMGSALSSHGILDQTIFTVAQFSLPNAVWLGWINVPTASAPIGSSPDFASGPIIPNSIHPLVFAGTTNRNGVLFDPNWSGQTDPTTALGLANPGQGFSHQPYFTAETFEFGNGSALSADGAYLHQFTETDALGNGWAINASFAVVPAAVVPLPSALLSSLAVLFMLSVMWVVRGRRNLVLGSL